MENFITLAKPDILQKDIDKIVDVLKSGNLIQGKEVLKLESFINSYLNINYSSIVSNGTTSLILALHTLNITENDEVIIPAFSYIATANVVELVKATPVFVDINLDTFNINEKKIEEKLNSKTKAIMPVHEFGLCANMKYILKIANDNDLYIIEDAACAIGAKINEEFAGTFGNFGSFSFHPRKAITSGEGGCLVTNKLEYDKKVKVLRNHGIEVNSKPMSFIEAGYNFRMTDFQAAMLYSQFQRLETIIEQKSKIAEIYQNEINNSKVIIPKQPSNYRHTWQTFHILLECETSRNKLMEFLLDNGVQSNYGAQCIPLMKFYKEKYHSNIQKEFPNAYTAYTCGLAIPIYERLTLKQIRYIITLINKF